MKPLLRPLTCLLLGLALLGCGNKGPLYLPDADPAASEDNDRPKKRQSY